MTEEAVAGLARAGCEAVWLGAENGSQKILDAMDKGLKVEDIPVARERLRKAGIRACYFIQFGYPGEEFSDIMATVKLVRETLPDDIGISVSNPLPGTKFHQMVKDEVDGQDQWEHSNDLAMLFQGTYQTPFYRKLHGLLHDDLKLLRRKQHGEPISQLELDAMTLAWQELEQTQKESRNACPTILPEHEASVAPDLSRRWN
jgi:anaerobic magnesium-protoporphyrin IX monomethyl ester cyclase